MKQYPSGSDSETPPKCPTSQIVIIKESQEAIVGHVRCIILSRKYVRQNKFDFSTFSSAIHKGGLVPVAKIPSGPNMASLYEKDSVDQLPYVKKIRARGDNELRNEGEIVIGGTTGIGLKCYALLKNLSNDRLKKAVVAAGLVPIGTAKSGENTVQVYCKAEVEKLSYVAKYNDVSSSKIEPNGEVNLGGIRCVCCSTLYSRKYRLDFNLFKKAIEHAQLPVIGKIRRGTHILKAYEKTAVEEIPYVKERVEKYSEQSAGIPDADPLMEATDPESKTLRKAGNELASLIAKNPCIQALLLNEIEIDDPDVEKKSTEQQLRKMLLQEFNAVLRRMHAMRMRHEDGVMKSDDDDEWQTAWNVIYTLEELFDEDGKHQATNFDAKVLSQLKRILSKFRKVYP